MPDRVSRRDALKGIASVASVSMLSKPAIGAHRAASTPPISRVARERSFDDDWRFRRGDAPGAEDPSFGDMDWRKLDLPHDWSIEDLPPRLESSESSAVWDHNSPETEIGPFSKTRSEGMAATGWVVGGIGWYRKTFATPERPKGGRVAVRFDGVYMNAEFWINGAKLGQHPYGYTGFEFDLTPHLREQGQNVLAVKVNNQGRNSRWYSGSGIYRHVWLTITGAVFVPLWGVYITSTEVSKSSATLAASVQVWNLGSADRRIKVQFRVVDVDGRAVAVSEEMQNVAQSGSAEIKFAPTVNRPKLWSPSDPNLYTAEIEVFANGQSIDRVSTSFGIRKIDVDSANGLRINGEVFKMRGGCLHHDNGILGSAAIDRAEERRVELMKANGFNAIRTSHNPPSPAFLDACDRLGVMVMDEAFDMWEEPKNPDDYHLYFKEWWQRDLDAMVLRDRNHPSVILWSIGNEIRERADPEGIQIAKQLTDRIRQLDKTRPITAAVNALFEAVLKGGKQRPWPDTDLAFQYLDVAGYNYEFKRFEQDHARKLERVMVETESDPILMADVWETINKLPHAIGDFVWTGMDYFGESGIGSAHLSSPNAKPMTLPKGLDLPGPKGAVFGGGNFPWFNAYCGDIDVIGNKKPQSYYRDVVWDRSPIEMAVLRPVPSGQVETVTAWGWYDDLRSWTWPGQEGVPMTVRIYTKADRVQLLLNGKEAGSADVSSVTDLSAGTIKLAATLTVPYAPGELKAIALKDDRPVVQASLRTVDAPYRVTMRPDRSVLRRGRNDLSYVMVQIEDVDGNLIPDAVAEVHFNISGVGDLLAAGNGNPKDMASFHGLCCRTFHGRCLAILRPRRESGQVTLQATSGGLQPAMVVIDVH